MSFPAIVRVENVSKRFVLRKDKSLKEQLVNFRRSRRHRDDFWALRDIDLTINAGATVGLIGHNGSGKSTLLKTIGGIIEPTTGAVYRRGRLAALLELGAGFHPDLTGRENVYLNAAILGLSQAETRRHFDEIVDFSGVEEFIDTQVKFYSSGMYVRLAFAVAVHVDPDLLLVDEVLAVGDEPFQRKCMDKVAQFQQEGRTIVVVSHSAELIGRLCDRAILLEHGAVEYDGEPAQALRKLREGFQRDRQREIERLLDRTDGVDLVARAQHTPVIIEDIRLSATEKAGETLTMRSALTVDLDIDVLDYTHPYDVGIGIESATGTPVFQISLSDVAQRVEGRPGRRTIRFDIPRHHLGAGHYVISVAVARERGEVVAGINPALWFEVASDSAGRGVVDLDARIVVQDLPQPTD